MFKKSLKLLEKIAFVFIFFCVACLSYSALAMTLFASIAPVWTIPFNVVAVIWCFFAGTLPILYIGIKQFCELIGVVTVTHSEE